MNSQTMKNALIIGGSTGIGLDAAKRLGVRGVTVTIAGRDPVKLETAAAEIKHAGSTKVNTKAVDLYDRAQVDGFAQEVASGTRFGQFSRLFFSDALSRTHPRKLSSIP